MAFDKTLVRLRSAAENGQRGRGDNVLVERYDLRELLHHFDRIDAALRAFYAEPTQSPHAPIHDFSWALIQMKAGKKVTREAQRVFWLQNCAFMSMAKDGSLRGGVHITTFDLLAKDWQLHQGGGND